MNTDIPAFSNAATKIRLRFVDSDRGPVSLPVELYVGSGESRISIAPDAYDSSLLVVPPLSSGIFSYTLLLGGHPVLKGNIRVAPSNLPEGNIDHHVLATVALPHIFLYTSTGPQGEKGERGFSSYEIAGQHGYTGTEADWVAELSGAQAAANEAKTQATAATASAKTAGEHATAAGKAQTAAESAAGNAEQAKSEAKSAAGEAGTSAADAGKSATQAATQAENAAASATAAGESATQAATQAGNAAASATAAGESATQAATQAGNAAASATAAGESATQAATQARNAAESAADAASTLASAAKLADNNTYSGVNTFNGSLVANGTTTLPAQTTVDGTSVPDLQEMQAALTVFLEGIGELSLETQLQPMRGCHAKTWNDWAALNPTWPQQDTLIFYAPFAPEANRANMASNAAVTNPSVLRSIWISPMLPDWDNSGGERISKALGKNICLYCTKSGDIVKSLGNCYYVKKATVITPNATKYENFMANLGYITSKTGNEMHIFAPDLKTITSTGQNSTFYYMPLLDEFSIYAPKLTTSFYFSYRTNHEDEYGYALGQTCAVLQALIAGIGTPETEQTITTSTPQGTDDEIAALEADATAKNWKFEYVKVKK